MKASLLIEIFLEDAGDMLVAEYPREIDLPFVPGVGTTIRIEPSLEFECHQVIYDLESGTLTLVMNVEHLCGVRCNEDEGTHNFEEWVPPFDPPRPA